MKKVFSITLALIFSFFQASTALAAFGLSPASIEYNYLKAGSTYSNKIILSTNNTSTDHPIAVKTTGDPELMQWLTIDKIDVFPAGIDQMPLKFSINVPADAELKTYKGGIFVSFSNNTKDSNLDINLGGNVGISFTVTNDEFVDYAINAMKVNQTTEGKAIQIASSVTNKGNVDLNALDGLTVEIWSENEKELIATYNQGNFTNAVPAYQSGNTFINLPSEDLPAGTYWAKANVTKNDQPIYSTKMFLKVVPQGSNGSVTTSIRVGSEDELRAAASSIQTSLRVKSPYEDVIIWTSVALVILIAGGIGYKKIKKRS